MAQRRKILAFGKWTLSAVVKRGIQLRSSRTRAALVEELAAAAVAAAAAAAAVVAGSSQVGLSQVDLSQVGLSQVGLSQAAPSQTPALAAVELAVVVGTSGPIDLEEASSHTLHVTASHTSRVVVRSTTPELTVPLYVDRSTTRAPALARRTSLLAAIQLTVVVELAPSTAFDLVSQLHVRMDWRQRLVPRWSTPGLPPDGDRACPGVGDAVLEGANAAEIVNGGGGACRFHLRGGVGGPFRFHRRYDQQGWGFSAGAPALALWWHGPQWLAVAVAVAVETVLVVQLNPCLQRLVWSAVVLSPHQR